MKLNYRRTFFVGLAFLSICAFWELYDGIVPKMLEGTFQMNETATGVVMAMDNVLALFLLPLLGAFSDRVSTRFGKRIPFIVIGTLMSSIFIIILPVAEYHKSLPIFMVALGMILLSMALYRSPAVALMPDITPKPLRSKANAIINLMGTLGGAYALLMISKLYKEDGSSELPVFLSIVIIMILAVALLVITIPENKLVEEMRTYEESAEIDSMNSSSIDAEKSKELNSKHDRKAKKEGFWKSKVNRSGMPADVRRSFYLIMASIFLWFFAYNAVKTAFSRYAEKVWDLKAGAYTSPLMVAIVAALISYIPIGFLSSKLGRKKMILIGILLLTGSYTCGFFVQDYSFSVNIIFAFTGIGWAAINVNSFPMVVEMCKGSDTGKYTGYYYTFSMASQVITPILSGFLLQNVSYRILFPYAIFFSAASFCTMLFVKHGDAKPEKKAHILENYDIDD